MNKKRKEMKPMNKTKRKIFNAAIELFSKNGYDNATVDDITAIAGVAKGSLYYHFSKKEDIFDMLLQEGLDLLRNSIELKTKNCKTKIPKPTPPKKVTDCPVSVFLIWYFELL